MKINAFGKEVTLSKYGEQKMKEALLDIKANKVRPKLSPKDLKYMRQKIGKV